jgi:SecD-like export protein
MRGLHGVVVLGALVLGACSSAPLQPLQPCNLTMIAVPPGVLITADDPLPANSQILATPGDFDLEGTRIEPDQSGSLSLILRLRGDAVGRLAAHTTAHTGDLIAIVLNGDVVSVPMIAATIADGEIAISGPSSDGDALASRFSGCAR